MFCEVLSYMSFGSTEKKGFPNKQNPVSEEYYLCIFCLQQ